MVKILPGAGMKISASSFEIAMKYAKKSLWHFICFSASGAYLRGVFLSTPYINKEVNHQAGSLQRLLVVLMNEFKAMVICGCAASIKNSSGLKMGGGFRLMF